MWLLRRLPGPKSVSAVLVVPCTRTVREDGNCSSCSCDGRKVRSAWPVFICLLSATAELVSCVDAHPAACCAQYGSSLPELADVLLLPVFAAPGCSRPQTALSGCVRSCESTATTPPLFAPENSVRTACATSWFSLCTFFTLVTARPHDSPFASSTGEIRFSVFLFTFSSPPSALFGRLFESRKLRLAGPPAPVVGACSRCPPLGPTYLEL
mmetsp:Transcript_3468/g.8155  ORF Transcript_3468/g.8155 Transcript_3468/m.8155 type:complete len:211 (-) Transcript_3468:1645-2277(-)